MKVKNYLRLNQLNVFYGSSQILFNLSFDAIRGKTLALLGRNGAGKSTTLKSLIGLVPISSGNYILNNKHLETLIVWANRCLVPCPDCFLHGDFKNICLL